MIEDDKNNETTRSSKTETLAPDLTSYLGNA
jgi:hypothetical protein